MCLPKDEHCLVLIQSNHRHTFSLLTSSLFMNQCSQMCNAHAWKAELTTLMMPSHTSSTKSMQTRQHGYGLSRSMSHSDMTSLKTGPTTPPHHAPAMARQLSYWGLQHYICDLLITCGPSS